MLQITLPGPYPGTTPPTRRRGGARRRGRRLGKISNFCPPDAIPPPATDVVKEDLDLRVPELHCISDTGNLAKVSKDGKCGEMKEYLEEKFARAVEVMKMPSGLMVEILSRLPVKSLLRFKCVCRLWCSLVREQYFINKHLENQCAKNRRGVIIGTGHYLTSFFSLCYLEEGSPIDYTCTVNRQSSGLSEVVGVGMSNSCNGLVCFFAFRSTFICNPATREYNMLPVGTEHARESNLLFGDPFCFTGLGFATSTGEYKVVRFFRISDGNGCEVLTLGSHSWRRIEKAPRGVMGRPAFVNGRIHWILYCGLGYADSEAVVSFDVSRERFAMIMCPEHQLRPVHRFVLNLGGHLCLGEKYNGGQMDLWILRDYGKSEWIKKFSINFTTMDGFSIGLFTGTYPVTIWGGKLVLSFPMKLDVYDPIDGGFKQIIQRGDHENFRWFCYVHVESLVSPSISPVRRTCHPVCEDMRMLK